MSDQQTVGRIVKWADVDEIGLTATIICPDCKATVYWSEVMNEDTCECGKVWTVQAIGTPGKKREDDE